MTRFATVVFKNSAFGLAGQLAIKLLSFGFSVLVVRHLGADSFGQYSAVLAFGAVFVFLGDMGLSPYTVRQVARLREAREGGRSRGELYGNVLALRLVLSVAAAMLVIGAAVVTGRPQVMVGAIALGALGLIMYAVQGSSEAVLVGFERVDLSVGTRVLNQLVFVVAGGAALWLGLGYYGLVIASLLGIALMTYSCWLGVRKLGVHPWRPDWRNWPPLLKSALPFGVIAFTLGLSYKFDIVLLNIYRGDAETGYYSSAYNLIFSAVVLSNVLNVALYPSLARQAVVQPWSLPRIYERALRYLMMVALPIAAGGFVLADQLVLFLFTSDYLPAVPALQIVIWAVPLMYASEFLGYIVVVRGEERRVASAIVVSTGFNVVLNLLLVPRFGYLAAAAMTVVTEAVLVCQYVWLLRHLLARLDLGRSLLRPLVATSLMAVLAITLRGLPLLFNVTLAAVSYLAALVLLRAAGRDEWRFLRGLGRSASEPADVRAGSMDLSSLPAAGLPVVRQGASTDVEAS